VEVIKLIIWRLLWAFVVLYRWHICG